MESIGDRARKVMLLASALNASGQIIANDRIVKNSKTSRLSDPERIRLEQEKFREQLRLANEVRNVIRNRLKRLYNLEPILIPFGRDMTQAIRDNCRQNNKAGDVYFGDMLILAQAEVIVFDQWLHDPTKTIDDLISVVRHGIFPATLRTPLQYRGLSRSRERNISIFESFTPIPIPNKDDLFERQDLFLPAQ